MKPKACFILKMVLSCVKVSCACAIVKVHRFQCMQILAVHTVGQSSMHEINPNGDPSAFSTIPSGPTWSYLVRPGKTFLFLVSQMRGTSSISIDYTQGENSDHNSTDRDKLAKLSH